MTEGSNPSPRDPQELVQRIGWVLSARVAILTIFLALWGISRLTGRVDPSDPTMSIVAILGLGYGWTALSLLLLQRTEGLRTRVDRLEHFALAQHIVDVLLLSAAVPLTGGLRSPMPVWYNLAILGAAAMLRPPAALYAASLSAMTYGLLMLLLFYGAVPDGWRFSPGAGESEVGFLLQILVNIASFFAIGWLANVFVERQEETETALADRDQALAVAESELERSEEERQRIEAEKRRSEEERARLEIEWQRSESERRRVESMQEALVANLGSGVIIVAADGRITSINHELETILGLEAASVQGIRVDELFPAFRPVVGSRGWIDPGAAPTELAYRPSADAPERSLRCRTIPLTDTFGQPFSTLFVVQDVSEIRELERRAGLAEEPPAELPDEVPARIEGMIGSSPAMEEVARLIERVARTRSTVLVTGESGTGKELVARAVHVLGDRRDKPFVVVNCGAIPETLIESELFGHVRGAFTGAIADRRGLFRAADGGTLFLDEIGELPLPMQVKLLRALQERSFTPVGGSSQVAVDVRILAATNRDLEAAVAGGTFREDLFYRLNVIRIELPPLRDRPEDLPFLVEHFLRRFAERLHRDTPVVSAGAMRRLVAYPFPGNIRELENVIEHAMSLFSGKEIEESDLPERLLEPKRAGASLPAAAVRISVPELPPASPPVAPASRSEVEAMQARGSNLDTEVEVLERRLITEALRLTGGVRKRAAELLGIKYRSLRHRLSKYGYSDSEEAEEMSDTLGDR